MKSRSVWLAALLGLAGFPAEAANMVGPNKRWPTGTIEVIICDHRDASSSRELCRPQKGGKPNRRGRLKSAEGETVRSAIAHWNTLFAHHIALEEVSAFSGPGGIVFRLSSRPTRCSTRRVGYLALEPVNFISVGARCNRGSESDRTGTGVLLHEIMHAVGFYHEQERSDRANYLNIEARRSARVVWGLACRDKLRKCEKGDRGNAFGPYDFASIMHYSMEGKRGSRSQITEMGRTQLEVYSSGETKTGQRDDLSVQDISAVRALYPADDGRSD